MTKSHAFPTFTLHNSHEPNSKPLDSLTAAECERLTDWSDKDKILYRTPDIKLKSMIERGGVTLNKRYSELHPMNEKRIFDKPHIEMK